MNASPRRRSPPLLVTGIAAAGLVLLALTFFLVPWGTCPYCLGVRAVTWKDFLGSADPAEASDLSTLNPAMKADAVIAHCVKCKKTGRRPPAHAWLKRPTAAMYALTGSGDFATLDEERLRRILAFRESTAERAP